jgi:hypothetical protein
MATYERVDYGSDDGAHFGGAATDKIGFFGATPVIQQVVVQQTTKTSAVLRAELTSLEDKLVLLGLISVT